MIRIVHHQIPMKQAERKALRNTITREPPAENEFDPPVIIQSSMSKKILFVPVCTIYRFFVVLFLILSYFLITPLKE